jgi:hypothetical protein
MLVLGVGLVAACAAAAMSACGGSSGGSSPVSPTATQPAVSLGYALTVDGGVRSNGGQPTAWNLNGNTMLYLASGPTCCSSYALTSTDGLGFSPAAVTNIFGNSFSFVTLPDGRYRMYYQNGADTMSRVSSDGFNWTNEDGVRLHIANTGSTRVGGVPRLVLAAGGYRIYYVQDCFCTTGIQSSFSSDGLTFSPDPGLRLAAPAVGPGWGDPSVINIGGGWLMTATLLSQNVLFSTIWLASSPDGLIWTLDAQPLVSDSTGSVVDSSWLALAGGSYRLYYGVFLGRGAAAPGASQGQPNTDVVKSGIVRKTSSSVTTQHVGNIVLPTLMVPPAGTASAPVVVFKRRTP